MFPVHLPRRLRGIRRWLRTLGIASLILLAAATVGSGQSPDVPKTGETSPPVTAAKDQNQSAMTAAKPRETAKKSPLEKTKADVAELSTLAEQLRDELNKINVNVLSLDILHKSEAIEKLAKKIKGEAGEL